MDTLFILMGSLASFLCIGNYLVYRVALSLEPNAARVVYDDPNSLILEEIRYWQVLCPSSHTPRVIQIRPLRTILNDVKEHERSIIISFDKKTMQVKFEFQIGGFRTWRYKKTLLANAERWLTKLFKDSTDDIHPRIWTPPLPYREKLLEDLNLSYYARKLNTSD
jgi:hypothetical protein